MALYKCVYYYYYYYATYIVLSTNHRTACNAMGVINRLMYNQYC